MNFMCHLTKSLLTLVNSLKKGILSKYHIPNPSILINRNPNPSIIINQNPSIIKNPKKGIEEHGGFLIELEQDPQGYQEWQRRFHLANKGNQKP